MHAGGSVRNGTSTPKKEAPESRLPSYHLKTQWGDSHPQTRHQVCRHSHLRCSSLQNHGQQLSIVCKHTGYGNLITKRTRTVSEALFFWDVRSSFSFKTMSSRVVLIPAFVAYKPLWTRNPSLDLSPSIHPLLQSHPPSTFTYKHPNAALDKAVAFQSPNPEASLFSALALWSLELQTFLWLWVPRPLCGPHALLGRTSSLSDNSLFSFSLSFHSSPMLFKLHFSF